jgi:hypothetical protein
MILINLYRSQIMSVVQEEVATVLKHLPPDGTLEDVQYGLYVLEKVKRGLADADAGRTLTQEEVEQRLAKWLNG